MRLFTTFVSLLATVKALENFIIPKWDLQSEAIAGSQIETLSSTNYDSSSWHHIGSKNTVFGGLLEAGVFNTDQLFYGKNLLTTVDYLPYYAPWYYRSEFNLSSSSGSHVFLTTNGITSKADIYFNGHEVANKTVQAGAYGGQTFDVTQYAADQNALIIKAYPTLYDDDFGLGWVDWNPYPPDNGTGVWRDVSIKQTGPLAMGSLRIIHDYTPGASTVRVTLRANVTNMESSSMTGVFEGMISGSTSNLGGYNTKSRQSYSFAASETKIVEVSSTIENPDIWWPKQWGDQPLYSAQASIVAQGQVSDQSPKTNFGIRTITSKLQDHYTDRVFSINGHEFQVRGGGYAPDMFLRWNAAKFEAQVQYILDMGMNTIRLEGKMEQPEMYDIADRMGLMIMPGWECCDKWEAWAYNNEVTAILWNPDNYRTADTMVRHEASVLQTHPSILTFLIGSDYWPNYGAASIYMAAFDDYDWPNPVVCSAAKRGYVKALGPSGLKMAGPYDYVPDSYWYEPGYKLGTAFGFGSELGSGVGTPEIGSLKKFSSPKELDELWQDPTAALYHQGNNQSSFHHRTRYNKGLYGRYGAPTSLDDYLLKAQIMDYAATRSQYEAFAAKWSDPYRPATGLIYWMTTNAFPEYHWNQFDYYLHPAGAYFGTKVGCRIENVVYDYVNNTIYLINQSLNQTGTRNIAIELIDLDGNALAQKNFSAETEPNTSKVVSEVPGMDKIENVAFLRLILTDSGGTVLSRNVYWLGTMLDELEWHKSTWFYTPVKTWANLTALSTLDTASVSVSVAAGSDGSATVTLKNTASIPAFFIRLNLVDSSGDDITPVIWSDNYVTLFPHESIVLQVSSSATSGTAIQASGWNLGAMKTINVG